MNVGLRAANIPVLQELERSLKNLCERIIGAALTHRTAMGGVSLVAGLVLATGADSIPQALLTLAAFAVAAKCLHEKEEKGGEV